MLFPTNGGRSSVRIIVVGTAYAIWTGMGTVGTAALGVSLFREAVSAQRLLYIGLIVVGILGLKLAPVSRQSP